ncbi:gamma-glutamyltranspeptidase [Novosphingobium colocasiae]|uniref:Glutathione hydrolase proenzyme n=1 Tax=Novosphingobium colocasiae TaxID=1256513 RepID=A0A918UFL3_9SPHN|nr:gamma-glutamyltranspeptidase [Novosphingobium colocasiae]
MLAGVTILLAGCSGGSAQVASTPPPPPPAAQSAIDLTGSQTDAWRDAPPVRAAHAMVVTNQHLATEIGLDVLRRGGNAVDAAVAVGFALAVVDPCCGNIGGGGFLTARLADGRTLFLDFRERAPLAATATMFQDAAGNVIKGASTDSWNAVATPGTVMGLAEALQRYGTLPLAKVMAPAIRLARDGFVLTEGDVAIMARSADKFARTPGAAAAFLKGGRTYAAGERLVQADLAATLEAIAKGGPDAFYKGPIAQAVADASKAGGGLLTTRDFAEYTVRWDKPVTCGYRGLGIIAPPPPSSGGTTLCEILQVIEPYPLAQWGYGSADATHVMAEAERFAFADRNESLGDPAFVNNPVEALISPARAAAIRARIRMDKATPSSEVKGGVPAQEGDHTTHYSVLDASGNAVSVTYTINYLFGSGLIAGKTGFFLNNEMDDFTAKPGVPNGFGLVQGAANAIAPGKRPLSSMTPTIVTKDGKVFMITGSPGGSTIITTVLQSIVNVVDFGMNMQAAVDAPRFHHQWLPDQIAFHHGYLTDPVRAELEARGHKLVEQPGWGADEAILVDPATGTIEGANDVRRPAGLAAGY